MMREALRFYAKHVANCRKVTSEGADACRTLNKDGGQIATTALKGATQ